MTIKRDIQNIKLFAGNILRNLTWTVKNVTYLTKIRTKFHLFFKFRATLTTERSGSVRLDVRLWLKRLFHSFCTFPSCALDKVCMRSPCHSPQIIYIYMRYIYYRSHYGALLCISACTVFVNVLLLRGICICLQELVIAVTNLLLLSQVCYSFRWICF